MTSFLEEAARITAYHDEQVKLGLERARERFYNQMLECSVEGCTNKRTYYLRICEAHWDAKQKRQREQGQRSAETRRRNRAARGERTPDNRWAMFANRCVGFAKQMGILPPLDGSVDCVDCGKPAAQWEHRDYARPLDVEPVCQSCNCKRGSARIRTAADYQHFVTEKDQAA